MSDGLLAVPVPKQARAPHEEPADPGPDLLAAADRAADALADALHDGPLQALVVARYATDAAVRGGDPALARDAVQEALVALRQTVWMMRPRGADGLVEALTELSKRRTTAGGTPLVLDLDAATADALPPAGRRAAYRFVQAATEDAAGATVALTAEGPYAVLTLRDATVADPAGWRARAAAIGGRLDSAADPVRLSLPLTPLRSDSEDTR